MAVRSDDAWLVKATLDGAPGAFGELARRYRDAAFGIAFHRLGDFEAARDVAQEAIVTAYVELPMLREPAKFAHWLGRITTMAALTELRRRRPTLSLDAPEAPEPAAGPDPAEALARSEKAREVQAALALLAEPDRLAVILHYVNGYSHEEIGGILGTTESAVKSRVYRARRRLREEMREMVESSLRSEVPRVELTEELVRAGLRRYERGMAVLEYPVFAALVYTERTRQAIGKVAAELAEEGYSWLVAPPHIPDGSPALPLLRDMGFQTEIELHWYERSLKGRLPAPPPLDPGVTVRPLVEADPAEVTALLRRTIQRHAPEAMSEAWVRQMMHDPALALDASSAAYTGDQLSAVLFVFAFPEANMKFGAATAALWWTAYDPALGTPRLLEHLLVAALRPLKQAGMRCLVAEQLRPHHGDEGLIPILEGVGFRYARSQWVLKLDLKAGMAAPGTPAPAAREAGTRTMRPLRYTALPVERDAALSQALEIRVEQVLGTAPVLAPGEVYVASGEYTLAEPVVPALVLACDGTSRGLKVGLSPGTHPLSASAEVLKVTPGKERELHLNMMGLGPKAITRVKIELQGWGE